MQRYFIQLSYDGTAYNGWQIQHNTLHTVQQVLNDVLSKLLSEPVFITGCGRTDTGVHATEFFAHFDSEKTDLHINTYKWLYKFNQSLPYDIAVQKIIAVHPTANARFDAISRTYQYKINQKKDPFLKNKSCFLHGDINFDEIKKATPLLFEYDDFTSFSKSNTQTLNNICKIYSADWKKEDDTWIFTICANRFLRNMVRAIVGTLLDIGKEKITAEEFKKIIESKTRSKAGFSAHACGLYLTKVEYPPDYFNDRN